MRVAYITAGAAGMYCGSCLHDNTLAAELMRLGHDVTLVPTYTPMRTDETDVSGGEVFFGAVNVFLQQKSALFRHTPRAIDWFLDRPALLDRVAALGASTSATDLGALALSMLQGEAGRQRKELTRLVEFLRTEIRPDVVHLTNSMFLGCAAALTRDLGVPVVCSLQGEDLFLDALVPPYRDDVLAEIRAHAGDVDAFTATSEYYRHHMAPLLGVSEDKIRVVPLGITLDGHEEPIIDDERPFTIGYLARVAPEKGLHHLVEGYKLLRDRLPDRAMRVQIAGYLGPGDRVYFDELMTRVGAWSLDDEIIYKGEVDRPTKLSFLSELDVLCVPTEYREAKGLFALEALASAVPVVVPSHGSFPELIERTGGGLLIEPGSAAAVADGLHALLDDPARRRSLGHAGRAAVLQHHGTEPMARATLTLYDDVVRNA